MRKYLLIVILLHQCLLAFPQLFDNTFNSNFAWNVKHINQFIDRFNNADEEFTQYNKKNNPQLVLSREVMLKSLFNLDNRNWNIAEIKTFIKEITDTSRQQYIPYYDMRWCAKVKCIVIWKSKPQNVVLTLKIVLQSDSSSKWVVSGVDAPFLKSKRLTDSLSNITYYIPQPVNHQSFLHPYSHATSFSNINLISNNKANVGDFFLLSNNSCLGEMKVFIDEIIKNRLIVKKAYAVQYYFFQIKGWIIEVSQFSRYSKNSGWLISKLTKT
ncbi:hypothetical protein [Mucilaginibacter paludis]|uniref:DUF3828 domain-containing protein n=1 Tax=Mucilaginibacter paludis DSM 18603 TaxID=714943 RepID=H1Y8M2_9SPHI|nr:hypothetical protein [Mucilaginibacter paludis]EHQ26894.1 hypothetical protein Mucpa_2782 [Mucilaginibacter paludis DSM 18603]